MEYVIKFFEDNEKRTIKRCKAGRLFTIITRMHKDLIRFVEYKNATLIEIDVKNFQPFTLNSFIKDLGYHNNKDAKHWLNITSAGKVYQYFMDLYNKSYKPKKGIIRDSIKRQLISIINGRIKDNSTYKTKKSKLYLLLEKKFPTVIKVLNEIKKDDYKDMSYELQSLEADIMIHTIATNYSCDYFILTKHDAVIIRLIDIINFKKSFFFHFGYLFDKKPKITLRKLDGSEYKDPTLPTYYYKNNNDSKSSKLISILS